MEDSGRRNWSRGGTNGTSSPAGHCTFNLKLSSRIGIVGLMVFSITNHSSTK